MAEIDGGVGSRPWIVVTAGMCVLASALAFLTDVPAFEVTRPDETRIKLVVRHSGILLGECTEMDEAALEQLAPNMRQPRVCPRGKAHAAVELAIGDTVVYRGEVSPSGLHDDGVLALYREFPVDAGSHRIRLEVTHRLQRGEHVDRLDESVDIEGDRIVLIEYDDDGARVYQPAAKS